LDPERQHVGPEREFLRRGELAAELAGRALDPIDPLRAGSGVHLALSLQRQAVYWALLARAGSGADTLQAVWDATPNDLLLVAAGDETALSQLRAIFIDRSFVEDAREATELVLAQGRAGQRFVGALLLAINPRRKARQVLWQRGLRSGILGVLLAVVLAAGYVGYERATRGEDLAVGKPWRTSSTFADCDRDRASCGGDQSRILFHTLEEQDPWFEIDLGARFKVAEVEVENRKDCCGDRAVPLVIEVSDNRKAWRAVARRDVPFQSWQASFDPVNARYVRVRVPRRSSLHLEHVAVRAR
jgi:hypothetical protein